MHAARVVGSAVVALAVAGVVGLVQDAAARAPRVGQVPNGVVSGCANCHVSAAGGGAFTSFGTQIYNGYLTDRSFLGSVVWGAPLAALDADGDDASNGKELGDPEGLWRFGSPNPGDPAAVTQPWNRDSRPPDDSAVAGSAWGRVKALLAELLQ